MSEIDIKVLIKGSGFSEVYVDGKSCGSLEDPENELPRFLRRFLDALTVENTRIRVENKDK